ncbi:NAD(P)-binding protein [Atractiella rhizophila]|nr:NAD(P)-binding protein [Atractiella rhizophila]
MPFNIDTLGSFLGSSIFSLKGGLLVLLLSLANNLPKPLSLESLRSDLLLPALRSTPNSVKALVIFALVKAVHDWLNFVALNRGTKRDPARFEKDGGKDLVLVTGGCTGIGADFVERISKHTRRIVVLDLAEVRNPQPGVKYYKCDVTKPEMVHEVAERIRSEVGEPTIIVNNAGVAVGSSILESTIDQYEFALRVNTIGNVVILKEFLPHIVKINHGHIITVASMAGFVSIPGLSQYSCSKAATLALHETLRIELVATYNASNVRTTLIAPGKVQTEMGANLADSDNQFVNPTLQPADVTKVMVRNILRGESEYALLPRFTGAQVPLVRCCEWFRRLLEKVRIQSTG